MIKTISVFALFCAATATVRELRSAPAPENVSSRLMIHVSSFPQYTTFHAWAIEMVGLCSLPVDGTICNACEWFCSEGERIAV